MGGLTRHPEMNHASRVPLRLLLVTDGDTIPAWLVKSLEAPERSGAAIVALVLRAAPVTAPGALFRLYQTMDRRLFRSSPDAHAPVKLETAVPNARVVVEADLPSAPRVDVVLDPFALLPDAWSGEPPRYGVWTVRFGVTSDPRTQSAPAFWEVVEGKLGTETRLCIRRAASDQTVSLYASVAPSDRRSASRTQNHVLWKVSAALARKIQELWEDPDRFLERLKTSAPFEVTRNPSRTPGNLAMLRAGTLLLGRYVADKWRDALYREQWALAYRHGTADGLAMESFHQLIPPMDRFWADPFPIRVGNDYYIFHEELLYATGKGTIVLTVMDETGRTTSPIPILERDYHLSYPFVFEWDGDLFMMPETAAHRQVELYRCVSFPAQWKLECVVLPGVKALDPTPVSLFGKWWLFANLPAYGAGSLDELHLFFSDSPVGPWTQHPANPIKSDVRSARPAGRIFEKQGQLYRPAQDCSTRYGGAVAINRIVQLSPDTYEEVETGRIGPSWGPRVEGVHTLNASGNLTVIDCLLRRRKFRSNRAAGFGTAAVGPHGGTAT